MQSVRNTGRLVGGFMLVQALLGAWGNFALLQPLMKAPGFLVNMAASPMLVSVAVVAGFVAAALTIAFAITAWPVTRPHSLALTLWVFALAIAGFVLNAAENSTLLAMLSLSQEHAKAGAENGAAFEAIAGVVRSARYWAHYTKLIVGVGMLVAFFLLLYRAALLPRWLAAVAGLAALLQLVAVTLPVFGSPINFTLRAPAGISFLAVALWLLVRGFNDAPAPGSGAQPAVSPL